MSGPMPPAQNGRGMFGIPHGSDYRPELDPFRGLFGGGGGGGQWRSGQGHGQANVPMPMPRPRAGSGVASGSGAGSGGRPAPTYTGQTQQILVRPPPKTDTRIAPGQPRPKLTPQDVDPNYKPAPAKVPLPPPRPGAPTTTPPPATTTTTTTPLPARAAQAPIPVPRPRPGDSFIDRAAIPPAAQGNPMVAALLAAMERRAAEGGTPALGTETEGGDASTTEVASKGNVSQGPPKTTPKTDPDAPKQPGRQGGIGSDTAAAARTAQVANYLTKTNRADMIPVDPNIEAMAKYEQQKRDLVQAILDANAPRPSNWHGAQQIGINIYNPLRPPDIPRTGPNAGQIKRGPYPKPNRAAKDSNMDFYRALNVQPGDKAAANRAIQALIKQREIAPSSITVAQDRILASIGKSDAFNLSIDPKVMFERLKPKPPEHIDPEPRKKGPMDTQFEIFPEFQNRTDAWRPGIATPGPIPDASEKVKGEGGYRVPEKGRSPTEAGASSGGDPAEKVTKTYIDRLGDPPKEGTPNAPTQKDIDKARRDRFNKDVPPAKGGTADDDDDDDNEEGGGSKED